MEVINLKRKKKIGQSEVLDALAGEKKPLSAGEIAIKLNEENVKKVFSIIKRLLEYEEIKFIEIPKDLAMKMYKAQRRMKLYYVA